jgi:hypothetical protein
MIKNVGLGMSPTKSLADFLLPMKRWQHRCNLTFPNQPPIFLAHSNVDKPSGSCHPMDAVP